MAFAYDHLVKLMQLRFVIIQLLYSSFTNILVML